MEWQLLKYSELTVDDLHDLMQLRVNVFVVEQNCPYPELDGKDRTALHVLGRGPDDDLLAYGRILPPLPGGLPAIGRVVVSEHARGTGAGRRLMEQCFIALDDRYGDRSNKIEAQAHLQRFYHSLGYRTTSEEFDLDGIPHVEMVLKVSG